VYVFCFVFSSRFQDSTVGAAKKAQKNCASHGFLRPRFEFKYQINPGPITLHKKEVMDEMQRITPDKSPGPDAVTNHMLRSGGEKFNTILHEVIAPLWEHQAQPSEWQKSLMQPIYKGGKEPKPDSAS